MAQRTGRERNRKPVRYSAGGSYPPRTGREFDRERRIARKRRRRRRLLQTLAAWILCILAVAAVALGVARFMNHLGTSRQRSLRAQGIEAMEQEKYQEAIEIFDQALSASDNSKSPLAVDILCRRAEAEYTLGDYEAASYTYNLLMNQDPSCPEYLYMASICNSELEKADQALQLYDRARELSSEKSETAGRMKALIALGPACRQAKKDDEALRLYEEAIGEGLTNEEIYNQMGLCQMDGENFEDAADSFDQGKIEAQENGNQELLQELSYNRAVCSEYLQQYEEALKLFQDYEEQFGSDENVRHEITFLESRVN